jgi:hypothetical protein
MEPELPDIRIVSVTTRVEDDEIGEPSVTITGAGFYEALGMLLVAIKSMMSEGEGAIDDDEYPSEWED